MTIHENHFYSLVEHIILYPITSILIQAISEGLKRLIKTINGLKKYIYTVISVLAC